MYFKKFQNIIGMWLAVIVGSIFMLLTTIHRLQFNDPSYTRSPLIGIEIILMILQLIIVVLYHPGNAIFQALKKQWKTAFLMVLSALIGFALLAAGVKIDAPTLLYMT